MNRPLLVKLAAAGASAILVATLAVRACLPERVAEPVSTQPQVQALPPPGHGSDRPLPTSEPLVAPSGTIPRATAPSAPQAYSAVTPTPLPGMGPPLREMDKAIFDRIAKNDMKRLDDVFPDKPYRVEMLRDAASGYIFSVRIALNRSRGWDERWHLTAEKVTRESTHPDDSGETLTYVLRNGRWMPQ